MANGIRRRQGTLRSGECNGVFRTVPNKFDGKYFAKVIKC